MSLFPNYILHVGIACLLWRPSPHKSLLSFGTNDSPERTREILNGLFQGKLPGRLDSMRASTQTKLADTGNTPRASVKRNLNRPHCTTHSLDRNIAPDMDNPKQKCKKRCMEMREKSAHEKVREKMREKCVKNA